MLLLELITMKNINIFLEFDVMGFTNSELITLQHSIYVEFANTAPDTNVWSYVGNGSDPQLWEIVTR